ncbi:MAG: DUF2806 domain-containing protein [Phenylobacterium sp.]|uniref:DUF2806 domain-containing protein n=1 Tax=Phenylobacterium sp. TaxID=1871053 RepID=UPI00391D3B81
MAPKPLKVKLWIEGLVASEMSGLEGELREERMSKNSGDPGEQSKAVAVAVLNETISGLPVPVAKGLVGAAYRLLGGAVAYPAAWLQRAVQGVEDGTAARTYVRNELAKAAASQAIADPNIVDRALWSILGNGLRKQINKEAVLKAAAEETARKHGEGKCDETSEPDADWMNIFERYAEDASSERMQTLWGRVLAGEARKTGTFSLRSLRFLSEVDQETAQCFEEFAQRVFSDFAPKKRGGRIEGHEFYVLNRLEVAGLLTGLDGNRIKIYTFNEDGKEYINTNDVVIILRGESGTRYTPSVYLLTDVGLQMLSLLTERDEWQAAKNCIKDIDKGGLKEILLSKLGSVPGDPTRLYPIGEPEVIWRASASD